MRTKTGDQAIDDPEEFWEDSIGRALDNLVALKDSKVERVNGLTLAEYGRKHGLKRLRAAVDMAKACESGAPGNPGFQPGNDCARGDGGVGEDLRALEHAHVLVRMAHGGGITWDPRTKEAVTSGIAVAMLGHEKVIQASDNGGRV